MQRDGRKQLFQLFWLECRRGGARLLRESRRRRGKE
jgi:hypothetical protein